MVFDGLTDEELMVMYQKGSESSFQVLYSRHSSKIYGFLKSRIRHSEKVGDIFQEVFVKIHRSKHLYNGSLPVLPWIFTVTKNVMIDEIRKDKKFKSNDGVDPDRIPALLDEKIFEGAATALIKHLPNPQQTAIELRYVDDKTFEEIAACLNTSPANVRQIVSRGIKRLKELMTQGDRS